MSHLRDARLARALRSAPDDAMEPAPATRHAILKAASQAVAPAPRVPWWRRLWQASGQSAMPWNAAFASLLLAGVITLVWRHEPVPQAQPDGSAAMAAAPQEPVRPGAASAPVPTAAQLEQAPAPAQVPRPTADAQVRQPSKAAAKDAAQPRRAAHEQAHSLSPAPVLQEAPAAAGSAGVAAQNAVPAPLPPPAAQAPAPVRDLELAAPQAAARPASPSVPTPPDERSNAAPRAPIAAAAPAPAPALARQAAPAGVTAELSQDTALRADAAAKAQVAPAWPAWTQLQLSRGGRTRDMDAGEAAVLARQLDQLSRAQRQAGATGVPAELAITLSRDGQRLGVVELGPQLLRWRPEGGPAIALQAPPALLAATLAEGQRLLP